jgi:hypothetical protein
VKALTAWIAALVLAAFFLSPIFALLSKVEGGVLREIVPARCV